jgi:Cysteine-rich CPCC
VGLPVSCCGFVTLPERGADDICPVCFWEDDGQDDHVADEVRGGPNYSLNLSETRRNVYRIGAVEERVLPQRDHRRTVSAR